MIAEITNQIKIMDRRGGNMAVSPIRNLLIIKDPPKDINIEINNIVRFS